MKDTVNIAIAGLGTVGIGVCKIIQQNADLLQKRSGKRIIVHAVSARDRSKSRGVDLSAARWFENPTIMATDPEIDLYVELIGGSEGVAKDSVEAALKAGKAVVTANKALIAHHGNELAVMAKKYNAALLCEAGVAGGIPAIKVLKEGLAANSFSDVYGIFNGTCNYILTEMRKTGREFSEVLQEAQDLGYAEADPSFDVDGVDAAHKISILTSLAFGTELAFDDVYIEGIRHISAADIEYADELGYRIKLLGIARKRADGRISQRVHPAMVQKESPISAIEGVFNGLVAEGDFVDKIVAEGRGAGEGPTASAVVADIIDIVQNRDLPLLGCDPDDLITMAPVDIEERYGAFYVRLMVLDRPGVIADISAILRDNKVSLESLIQRGRAPGEAVPVVFTTHETEESFMQKALLAIAKLDSVIEDPRMIRIESY